MANKKVSAAVAERVETEFVSREEVMAVLEKLAGLKVTLRTLDRWHQERQGPPRVRLGRSVVYNLADLREWVRGNVEGGPQHNGGRARKPRK